MFAESKIQFVFSNRNRFHQLPGKEMYCMSNKRENKLDFPMTFDDNSELTIKNERRSVIFKVIFQ